MPSLRCLRWRRRVRLCLGGPVHALILMQSLCGRGPRRPGRSGPQRVCPRETHPTVPPLSSHEPPDLPLCPELPIECPSEVHPERDFPCPVRLLGARRAPGLPPAPPSWHFITSVRWSAGVSQPQLTSSRGETALHKPSRRPWFSSDTIS